MTIQEYTENLLSYLAVDPENMQLEDNEEFVFITLDIPEEDAGKMIGKHGETIAALNHVVRVSFRDELGEKRVVVDVNGYKERKEEDARDLGIQAAERALETNRPQHLTELLLPHERRAIHQELDGYNGVFTRSEGEGMDRHLVVYPESYRDEVGE